MIRIGICDDEKVLRETLGKMCKGYLSGNRIEFTIIPFGCGEAVLKYCGQRENERIDLLFLDIELKELDGITLKNGLLKNDKVWRIVFVSGYSNRMADSFGLKTIGFVTKPPGQEEIERFLEMVLGELEEEEVIEVGNAAGTEVRPVRLEDVEYIVADGNYTYIYLHPNEDGAEKILTIKKIGLWEQELKDKHVVRVQKSYMVNLANVVKVTNQKVNLRDMDVEIPIGRTYRDSFRKQYAEYIRGKIKRRI